MTKEAKTTIKTAEELFRERHLWVNERVLAENNLVVLRNTEPIQDSDWYRERILVLTHGYSVGSINQEIIVAVVNTFNGHGMASDSKITVLNPDKAKTPLNLGLSLTFALVSSKKSPSINIHYEKTTSYTAENVNNFFTGALGLKTPLEIEVERYAIDRSLRMQ